MSERLFDEDNLVVSTQITRDARAYWVCQPIPPTRTTYSGGTSSIWKEWHWARGHDPESERRQLPARVRSAVLERDGWICQLCAQPIERGRAHIDHILPVSRGGTDALDNLQAAHGTCNMRKGARV